MSTEYTRTVTIAVPAAMVDDANHLACLLGEAAADVGTFGYLGYQDAAGDMYAVASTVVKPVFLAPAQTGTLPVTPDHGIGIIDRGKAQRGLDSLNQAGGIQMRTNMPFSDALEELGLTCRAYTENVDA
jgi:hypothetical protein